MNNSSSQVDNGRYGSFPHCTKRPQDSSGISASYLFSHGYIQAFELSECVLPKHTTYSGIEKLFDEENFKKYVVLEKIDMVANFCTVSNEDKFNLGSVMVELMNDPKYEVLFNEFAFDFDDNTLEEALNSAIAECKSKCVCSQDFGLDIHSNVLQIFAVFLKRLVKGGVNAALSVQDTNARLCQPRAARPVQFPTRLKASKHTCSMLRCWIKLRCISKFNGASASVHEERHEVYKAMIVEMARYSDVIYSIDEECYLLDDDEEYQVLTSKADIELHMGPCCEELDYTLIPRLLVEVHGKKEDPNAGDYKSSASDVGCVQHLDTHSGAVIPEDVHKDSSVPIPESSAAGYVLEKALEPEQLDPVTNKVHKDKKTDDVETDEDFEQMPFDALPNELKKDRTPRDVCVKDKIFGTHAAQLLTLEQRLKHLMPWKGAAIGLYVHNSKVFFTKLACGNKGKTFTISNWCLNIEKFTDRLVLQLFLYAYCSHAVNIRGCGIGRRA